MNPDKTVENMEQKFSALSAEDLENLEVEELEQRLELAAIDYTATIITFAAIKTPDCRTLGVWFC
ncbi:hypothetical protein PCC9214_02518 [Planktothrix tepida]|uniref:Uncharacterized protein n=1 Tax=Planktothrix tepida PCC 9214 TaxID=671072 RepID=A0A1J1LKV7_9CYAN|nr:hypothetical protein [Planktothrix tepida]CAD5950433.1 hypothetical protein PCC9214_02518 [Planktothrix tepida]CUR32564.1 hypothetical protein PL9214490111 [Planktothrix tepida PCC 9214]